MHGQCPQMFDGSSGWKQVEAAVTELHLAGADHMEQRRRLCASHPGEHALGTCRAGQGLEEQPARVLGVVDGTQNCVQVVPQSASGTEPGTVALFFVSAAVAVQVEGGNSCAVHADGVAVCIAPGQHPAVRTSGGQAPWVRVADE